MDITTEVSMDDFDLHFDELDEFGDLGDDLVQSTEMIEMEISRQAGIGNFSLDLDD